MCVCVCVCARTWCLQVEGAAGAAAEGMEMEVGGLLPCLW